MRTQIGDGHAICGLSGGVDSAVAAALVQRAIGDRLTCVFVDHGLLRAGEREQVQRDFVAATGAQLFTVDAVDKFLGELEGISDPEEKRKTIGREFIRSFEGAVAEVVAQKLGQLRSPAVEYLVQGTLYPDVVESGGGSGTANIKSHHNVGGLPDDLEFELVEPLRLLFKDEVRAVGRQLGLPEEIVGRQPFPGPGSRSESSARSPPTDSRRYARPMPSRARNSPRRDWTARSGSARWCCSPRSAAWVCRATGARTAIPSCCARSPARTP